MIGLVRVAGVDPGTGSMDILVLDDEEPRVLEEHVIPRDEVTEDPGLPLRILLDAHRRYGLDAIVAPSGYGLPLKLARMASPEELGEATFIHHRDEVRRLRIIGLRRLMWLIKQSTLPAWFTPGVIHLPTVPSWRKLNRIDMGTADKLFTVAAALRDEVEIHGTPLHETTFIVVEAGMAYNAFIAVEGGRVIDGLGGTAAFPGFLGMGFMDAELAYALSAVDPGFSKQRLFQGGAASIAGVRTPEELGEALREGKEGAEDAARLLEESIAKGVAALLAVVRKPKRVYLSGRLFRTQVLGQRLKQAVESLLTDLGLDARVSWVTRLGRDTKEGATGAALIASGLAGGRYEWLVESLKLRESRGSIFDHIRLDGEVEAAIRKLFRRSP